MARRMLHAMTATVRVRARSTIIGLVYGEEVTLELTDQVDALIRSGKLELLDEADERAALMARLRIEAEGLGVRIDGRWGPEGLQRAIDEELQQTP